MVKCLKLFAVIACLGLAFGCAARGNPAVPVEQVLNDKDTRAAAESPLQENDRSTGQKLVSKAKTAIGTPYVLGGTTPGGFDCSGFVKWAYNSVGVTLPRTAREQSTVGQKVKNVEDMREGDIVAFRHPKRGYHTGIYVGDGKFIHSPRQKTRVRINSLSEPYFSQTLLGARRVAISGTTDVVAEAESRLGEYAGQKNGKSSVSRQSVAKNDKNKRTRGSRSSKSTVAENSKTKKDVSKNTRNSKRTKNNPKRSDSRAVSML